MKGVLFACLLAGIAVISTNAAAERFTVSFTDDAGTVTPINNVDAVDMAPIDFPSEEVSALTPDLPAGLAQVRTDGFVLYRTRPGNKNHHTFKLARQYGGTKEFQDWFNKVRDGKVERLTVTIT